MIGTSLLNYRVTGELGSGGLGTVYAAEHTIIGRRAAIKVLNPAIATDESMVQRFLAEARAVAAIRHPNIVDVNDYGKCEDVYVIVMELLEGETLALRLERDRWLDEPVAVNMLTQLTSALSAAHEQGVVHRDLKPENIFLTSYPDYPDFVKLLDFGIAKLLAGGAGQKTSPGLLVGTPAYMSPEQCLGDESLDHRSDIYSLGLVAYRMLTGQLPYSGNMMQLLQGHLTGSPEPLTSLRPSISRALADTVLRCLAREPTARFQSMQALRDALAGVTSHAPERPAPEVPAPAAPTPALELPVKLPMAPEAPEVSATAVTPRAPTLAPRQPTRAESDRPTLDERQKVVAVATRMRDIIAKRLQSNSLRLPSLPDVAVRCLELAHDVDVAFSSLATLIERDPFIASRVLRSANSPLYGGLARITTIEGALTRLGMTTVVTLLQELAAEQVFASKDPTIRDAFRGIWEHGLGVARVARDLGTLLRTVKPNTAYLAGLFHDIGKPIVAALLLEVERGAAQRAWLTGRLFRMVVDECHRDVGAVIAFRWFLPREVASAVAELDWYDLKHGRYSTRNVVRLANALCQREGIDVRRDEPEQAERVITQGRQVLRLSDEDLLRVTAGLVRKVQALTSQPTSEAASARPAERTGTGP